LDNTSASSHLFGHRFGLPFTDSLGVLQTCCSVGRNYFTPPANPSLPSRRLLFPLLLSSRTFAAASLLLHVPPFAPTLPMPDPSASVLAYIKQTSAHVNFACRIVALVVANRRQAHRDPVTISRSGPTFAIGKLALVSVQVQSNALFLLCQSRGIIPPALSTITQSRWISGSVLASLHGSLLYYKGIMLSCNIATTSLRCPLLMSSARCMQEHFV
jgi:hypothetical protein